jgi:hypothetical protein
LGSLRLLTLFATHATLNSETGVIVGSPILAGVAS